MNSELTISNHYTPKQRKKKQQIRAYEINMIYKSPPNSYHTEEGGILCVKKKNAHVKPQVNSNRIVCMCVFICA